MEPFRAFVADKLPEQQRSTGFAMQSLFIGIGAVAAGMMPSILREWFGVSGEADAASALPMNVRISFYVGAVAFLTAVLWTIFSTGEEPPADLAEFRRQQAAGGGLAHLVKEIPDALAHMPRTMRQLAVAQFFTWLGLFCMWLHFSNAVPVILGTSNPKDDLFTRGVELAGRCYAAKDFVTFIAAFGLIAAAKRMNRRYLHAACLVVGGVGLLAVGSIHGWDQRYLLIGALALGGIAWASILAMPYAILAGALPPARMGVYMGIFNFFIVLPEILASLFFGALVKHLLHGNLVHAVMAGGVCLFVAALLMVVWVREPETTAAAPATP